MPGSSAGVDVDGLLLGPIKPTIQRQSRPIGSFCVGVACWLPELAYTSSLLAVRLFIRESPFPFVYSHHASHSVAVRCSREG